MGGPISGKLAEERPLTRHTPEPMQRPHPILYISYTKILSSLLFSSFALSLRISMASVIDSDDKAINCVIQRVIAKAKQRRFVYYSIFFLHFNLIYLITY